MCVCALGPPKLMLTLRLFCYGGHAGQPALARRYYNKASVYGRC